MSNSFEDIALNPAVIASMVAATSSGFGGLLGWFFHRMISRNTTTSKNLAAQLEASSQLIRSLLDRVQFLEEKDLKMDNILTEVRNRLTLCEKERVSLTRENVRLAFNARNNITSSDD